MAELIHPVPKATAKKVVLPGLAVKKTIDAQSMRLMRLVKKPILFWYIDPAGNLAAFHKGGAIDDPCAFLKQDDVIESLSFEDEDGKARVCLTGVKVTQRIGELAIVTCAHSSILGKVHEIPQVPRPAGFWRRLISYF